MKKSILLKVLFAFIVFPSVQKVVAVVAAPAAPAELVYSVSNETRARLKRMDQRFCFFKYFTGCKYPYAIIVDEATYTVKTLLCGAEEETNKYVLVKKPEQLKNLVVLHNTTYSPDANIKFVEIYKGYRESLLGQVVEDTLNVVSILPAKSYSGTVLYDEYVSGDHMKWVLKDITDFRAVKAYLLKKFHEAGLVVPVRKPLLALEFEKGEQSFNAEDVDFLSTYFELADPADQEIKAFYKGCQEVLSEATKNFGPSTKQVGQKFGDLLMNTLEKPTEGFKPEVIALVGISVVAGFLLSELIKQPLKNFGKKVLGTDKK